MIGVWGWLFSNDITGNVYGIFIYGGLDTGTVDTGTVDTGNVYSSFWFGGVCIGWCWGK